MHYATLYLVSPIPQLTLSYDITALTNERRSSHHHLIFCCFMVHYSTKGWLHHIHSKNNIIALWSSFVGANQWSTTQNSTTQNSTTQLHSSTQQNKTKNMKIWKNMKLIKIDGRNAKHHHFGNAINGREDVQVDGRTNDSVAMNRLECEGRDDINIITSLTFQSIHRHRIIRSSINLYIFSSVNCIAKVMVFCISSIDFDQLHIFSYFHIFCFVLLCWRV